MRLLRRFSSSLLSVQYTSTADAPSDLGVTQRKVSLSFDALKYLQENSNGVLTRGKMPHVGRKKAKTATHNRHIDSLPFDSMGMTVPTTNAEVRDVYVAVLSQLRSILEVCGFVTDGLRVELNDPSITYSCSGSHCYRICSNPRTSRRTYHQKEGQINLGAQHFLWFNR